MKIKLFLFFILTLFSASLVYASSFSFTMNEKYSYITEVKYVDFDVVPTGRTGETMITASEQKIERIGNHNFMFYKEGKYKEGSREIPCYYFVFHYESGIPNPSYNVNGMLVVNEAGELIFIKFCQSAVSESYKFTVKVEKKGNFYSVTYLDESTKTPKQGSLTINGNNLFFIDENYIFSFAVFTKTNNPYNKDKFIINAIIPLTRLTQKNMAISKPTSSSSQLYAAYSLDNNPVFYKEGEITIGSSDESYITAEIFEIEFVQKGQESFILDGKTINTKSFESSKYNLMIYVDEEGNLFRFSSPNKRYTLIEKKIVEPEK